MAAAGAQTFITVVVFVLSGGRLLCSFKVPEGGVASLSCQYSVQRFGLSRVCWGRGCGTFWCSNILVQTDENGVITKAEDRYRLTGDVLDGQMDLDIVGVRRTDSGPYCCRVDIDGIFNDQKTIMNLRVVKAPISILITNPPTSTIITMATTTMMATTTIMDPPTPTMSWKILLSSQLDLLKRKNSTLLQAAAVDDSQPSLSLQINVPILSLSVTVLLLVSFTFAFVAFRRGIHRRNLKPDWRRVGCARNPCLMLIRLRFPFLF
ncbi:T-cell immunoglobulin and mucin domain-containing protein 4 isoform 2-T2 [Pholidichthys leucotaenia]